MQTLKDLSGAIILLIFGLTFTISYLCPTDFWDWFWLIIGILDLLFSIPAIIKYFIKKNKKK